MSDLTSQISDGWVGCLGKCQIATMLCVGMLAAGILAGCDRRPEVVRQSRPGAASESSMSVASSSEPLEAASDANSSGDTVNTEPANPEPANPEPANAELTIVQPRKPRSDEDPVSMHLSVASEALRAGETVEVTVTLGIDTGFEIHSLTAVPPKIPTRLELELPMGFTAVEEWRASAPVRSYNPGGGAVYVGEAHFKRRIHVAADAKPGDYLIACAVSYQACNSRQCLRPTESQLSIAVSISR